MMEDAKSQKQTFHWIDDTVKIDFPIPKVLENEMKEAEKLDMENSYEYFYSADAIDIFCKNLVSANKMTFKQWDTVISRYRT